MIYVKCDILLNMIYGVWGNNIYYAWGSYVAIMVMAVGILDPLDLGRGGYAIYDIHREIFPGWYLLVYEGRVL